jgi:hypothetical protein
VSCKKTCKCQCNTTGCECWDLVLPAKQRVFVATATGVEVRPKGRKS